MKEIITTTKRWGNSVGLIIPKELGIHSGQEVILHIEPTKKVTTVKELFGKLKFKTPTQKLMKEIDEELDS